MTDKNIINLDLGMDLDDKELEELEIIQTPKAKTLADDIKIPEKIEESKKEKSTTQRDESR